MLKLLGFCQKTWVYPPKHYQKTGVVTQVCINPEFVNVGYVGAGEGDRLAFAKQITILRTIQLWCPKPPLVHQH